MADVIEGFYEVRWREPVWAKIGYGYPEAVRGPKQAVGYLTFRWPTIRSDQFREAVRYCRLALGKELGCDDARQAFIRAAQEADVDGVTRHQQNAVSRTCDGFPFRSRMKGDANPPPPIITREIEDGSGSK